MQLNKCRKINQEPATRKGTYPVRYVTLLQLSHNTLLDTASL
jgi:hypothetical protein